MKRLRQDVNYLISAFLLVAASIAIMTGIVAHLWDLNDFVYHTYSGYALTIFSLAHVYLNWGRMIGYARFRLSPRRAAPRPAAAAASQPSSGAPVPSDRAISSRLLPRRGFLALLVGGLGGYVWGRGLRQQPPIAQGDDLGVVYHEWSKPGVIDVLGTVSNWGQQPPLYKSYPEAPQIVLPRAGSGGGISTEAAINRRRSVREYSGDTMSLDELSRVLYYTSGINSERWGHRLRTAPSSGALYPIEVYPVVHNVDGLVQGVYHYNIERHALELIRPGDHRGEVIRQGLSQQFLGQANVVLFLTVIFQRMRWKYQDRTYRYGLIEAGHLGQNVYLSATSIGLGACAVGAFMDDAINVMLGVDGKEEAAIYMLAVGKM